MRISIGEVDGPSWQEYCERLLKIRHNDYQSVPSKFAGDLGIEGFTRSGISFQCYCPDGDLPATVLYEKQRDKITRNINDLIKNETELAKLLGQTKIREWHFLTPKYENRQLLVHCQNKVSEVLAKQCGHIDRSFQIYIKTEDDYMPERQQLIGLVNQISPSVEKVEDAHVTDWIDKNNEAFGIIDRKLAKVISDDKRRRKFVEENLKSFLVGSSMLEKIRQGHHEYYERIMKMKRAEEAQVTQFSLLGTDNNGRYLKETIERYESLLCHQFEQTVDRAVLQWLKSEAISDWLLRCPLDFYEVG